MGIEAKQLRTITYHLRVIFSGSGFEPDSIDAARRLGQQYLWHEFRLKNARTILLTAKGMASFEAICNILRNAQLVPQTEPADAVNQFRAVLRDRLDDEQMPENGAELVELLKGRLEASRHKFWRVVPVHGLELQGVKSVPLGCLTLERPTTESLEGLGAKVSDREAVEEMVGGGLCLVGAVYGSEAFSRREFAFRTDVVIGVLAVVAAACFEQGANPFRITSETVASGVRAARRGMYWSDDASGVTWTRSVMEHQNFQIDSELAEFLQCAGYVKHALGLAAKPDLSALEQALIRGLFWFSDAQRDTFRVMQLVKYWSCAEVIFSVDGEGITKAVTEGVASVLVGGIQVEPPERYKELVSILTRLYELRCEAVHDARFDHVSYQDVATLSRWIGWMLLGVAGLIRELNYTSADQVRQQSLRLSGVFKRATAPES